MEKESANPLVEGVVMDLFDCGEKIASIPIHSDGSWSVSLSGQLTGEHRYLVKSPDARVESNVWKLVVSTLDLGADHTHDVGPVYCIVPGLPPLPAPSAGRYSREATGGVPPYSYSSSNPQIAIVAPDSGDAVAADNGTAVITVTDANGASAHYSLTFTGVERVQLWEDEVSWGASEAERPWRSVALDLNGMSRLYNTYSAVGGVVAYLKWPNKPYWTSDNNPADATAYAFTLHTDAQGFLEAGGTMLPTVRKAAGEG